MVDGSREKGDVTKGKRDKIVLIVVKMRLVKPQKVVVLNLTLLSSPPKKGDTLQ